MNRPLSCFLAACATSYLVELTTLGVNVHAGRHAFEATTPLPLVGLRACFVGMVVFQPRSPQFDIALQPLYSRVSLVFSLYRRAVSSQTRAVDSPPALRSHLSPHVLVAVQAPHTSDSAAVHDVALRTRSSSLTARCYRRVH